MDRRAANEVDVVSKREKGRQDWNVFEDKRDERWLRQEVESA